MATSYRTEFPDFPEADMPAIPAGFEDQSWHNDMCPVFFEAATDLEVWVDYLDPAKREIPEITRFRVQRRPLDHTDTIAPDPILETDDWQAVLDCVLGEAFVHYLKRDLTAAQWDEMKRRNAADPDHATGSVCHSHDFCDANMPMLEAFKAIYGREPFEDDATRDADTDLMNAAWAYAAKKHLTAAPAAEPDWRALCAALLPYAESRAEDMSESQIEIEAEPHLYDPNTIAESAACRDAAWEAVEAARAALARTAR